MAALKQAGSVKVTVEKATDLLNKDVGPRNYTDGYVCVCVDGQWQQTKVVKDSLNPQWNETFAFHVDDCMTSSVLFTVWDHDNVTDDDLIGSCAVSLTSLVQDEPRSFSLPIQRRPQEKRRDAGTLIVTLTSQDFTGLVGVTRSLNEVEKRLRDDVLRLGAEVDDLKKVRESLQIEVGKLSDENKKYEQLNGELRQSVNKLDGEVTRLTTEVDRFKEQNDRLDSEIVHFKGENEKLEKTREALNVEIASLKSEVTAFHSENQALKETREALDLQVSALSSEVKTFSEENEKLKKIESALGDDVAALGNKVRVLSGEITNLQKTRELLDEQVQKQEANNRELTSELQKLHSIREGMASFAVKQESDYKTFVDQLSSSLSRHEKLLREFSEENSKLKNNRHQMKIDSLLALSNSFAMWDHKVGLSIEEFQSYLSLIGPAFEALFAEKYGGNLGSAFAKLDTDKNGTLNIQELRALLNELVTEEKE